MLDKSSTNLETYIKKISPQYYWIVSAVLAMVVMLFAFSVSDLLANGKYVISRVDMDQQYFPVMDYLKSVLKGEHSYWFAWSNGLGQGSCGLISYLVFSPFNLAFLIIPREYYLTAAVIVIVLKTATSAAIMQIFLAYFLRTKRYSTVIFSICYALCAFQVNYYFALNFSDAIYIFPWTMLGVVYLIRERKIGILLSAYIFMFAYNFYFGYIIGVSSFVLGLSYFIYSEKEEERTYSLNIMKKYIFSVISSILVTAIIWLPSVLQIFMYGEEDYPYVSPIVVNPLIIVNNLMAGQMQNIDGFAPYVYCGLISLLLFVCYFFNKKIKVKERIYAFAIVTLYILFMCIEPLNRFMQAFDTPQKMGFRYSFVLSFIICVIACRQITYVRNINLKYIVGTCLGLVYVFVSTYYYFNKYYNDANSNDILDFCVNIGIICVYILLWYIARKRKTDLFTLRVLITAVVCAELIASSSICLKRIDIESLRRDVYYIGKEVENNTFENIPKRSDKDFYRIQGVCYRNTNLGLERDYNSVGGFSSMAQKNVLDFMMNMGVERGMHIVYQRGMTDALKAILGVKYSVNFDVEKNNALTWFLEDEDNLIAQYIHENEGVGSSTIIENDNYLSLGFMTYGDIENIDMNDSPFYNQDVLLSKMTGEQIDCYKEVVPKVYVNGAIVGNVEELESMGVKLDGIDSMLRDKQLFVVLDDESVKKILENDKIDIEHKELDKEYKNEIWFEVEDTGKDVGCYFKRDYLYLSKLNILSDYDTKFNEYFSPPHNLGLPYLRWLGKNEDGKLEVKMILDNVNLCDYCKDYYFAEYDKSEFEKAYNILSKLQLQIDTYNDGYVKGNIDAGEGGVMFTSIPYSKGWSAIVDGKKVNVLPIVNSTFVGLNLTEGRHEIELQYTAPGMIGGLCITSLGLIMIVIWIIIVHKRKTIDMQ